MPPLGMPSPFPLLIPRPVAPFVVSLIGGVFILLGGLVELAFFSIGVPTGSFFGVPFWLTGSLGLALGPAIMILAILFYHKPEHAVVCGSLIVAMSVVSFLSFAGGFYVGLILGLIGGILTLVWRPVAYPMGFYPTLAPSPAYRMCLKCGRTVVADARFCSYCGNVFV
jgi:hypothetical protein